MVPDGNHLIRLPGGSPVDRCRLGHVLAQMPTALWTDDAALATWDMLRKYRGQLATAGIGYDDLPCPAGVDELEAGRHEQARQRVRTAIRSRNGAGSEELGVVLAYGRRRAVDAAGGACLC